MSRKHEESHRVRQLDTHAVFPAPLRLARNAKKEDVKSSNRIRKSFFRKRAARKLTLNFVELLAVSIARIT